MDISDVPAVSNPGLTRIFVEELLPNCEVLGTEIRVRGAVSEHSQPLPRLWPPPYQLDLRKAVLRV